ncbi:DNA primase [Rickettsiales endosymbiont of Peranema trichophorum]|uniref:DNA primase n=1 Tax=Rickettsiales endosymbiont of Peranema trichophorum TaxID=2486577 RepID=UPI001022A35B|nr:DNA primase [Rickettsiales endosymbiont of Peranema trichophorum]RZI47678.1 DNA primase [Rickettsiales endosymbiont of Peranema trichophorum]
MNAVKMSDIVDKIKDALHLSGYVSRKVRLSKKKNGAFLGLCPFHGEKTPSFHVNDEKGVYYCFGCQAHGDIFEYVMRSENVSFKDALELLADAAGIKIPKNGDDKAQEVYKQFTSIYEIVANYYRRKLTSVEGKNALKYLKGRNLSPATIEEYGLGYAPNSANELLSILREQFSEEDIMSSKILIEGTYGIYNQFRNRVIFPIFSRQGAVIAFGGRSLDDTMPKYLNSPETPIFAKSQVLYGLNFAKQHITKERKVLIVEGYMDVLALANVGILNAVAPLGTALGAAHINMLWRIVDCPTICLDNDEAGQRAMVRIAEEILPHLRENKTLEFVLLSGGKDPDEIVTKRGQGYFQSICATAVPLSQLIFDHEVRTSSFTTPEGYASLKKRLNKYSDSIVDRDIKNAYRRFFSNKHYELSLFKKNIKYDLKERRGVGIINLTKLSFAEQVSVMRVLEELKNAPELLYDDAIYNLLYTVSIESDCLDSLRGLILDLKVAGNNNQEVAQITISKMLQKYYEENSEVVLYRNSHCAEYVEPNMESADRIKREIKVLLLHLLRPEINRISELLIAKCDNETYKYLNKLKCYEMELQKELGIHTIHELITV